MNFWCSCSILDPDCTGVQHVSGWWGTALIAHSRSLPLWLLLICQAPLLELCSFRALHAKVIHHSLQKTIWSAFLFGITMAFYVNTCNCYWWEGIWVETSIFHPSPQMNNLRAFVWRGSVQYIKKEKRIVPFQWRSVGKMIECVCMDGRLCLEQHIHFVFIFHVDNIYWDYNWGWLIVLSISWFNTIL